MCSGLVFDIFILITARFLVRHCSAVTQHGKYTRNLQEYNLIVPHRLSENGDFLSFKIPHFYEHESIGKAKRSTEDESAYYGIKLDGKYLQLNLRPNHGFISPDAISEIREPKTPIQDRRINKVLRKRMCHFRGHVRGIPGSRVALSTCNGLAGYISIDNQKYFIEPLHEHQANKLGQHLHMIYKRDIQNPYEHDDRCGLSRNWETEWKKTLKNKYAKDHSLSISKRGLASVQRYMELLIVVDKKFIKFHKFHDIETYILTIMNMVADFYRDPSNGNAMEIVVVRVMYLEKQEDEIDLMIVDNAEDTLSSFCKWQMRVNPKDVKNPNHHDIAVLLTRHDLCGDNGTKCGLEGLAYVGTPCTPDEPCAINEDSGLILSIVLTHELGHVMGCSHDAPDDSGCESKDPKDGSNYVMAPFVNLNTIRWSTCSRAFITTLFESDLGECLNDEPQKSIYKQTEILPGVVYDAQAQCEMMYPGSKYETYDPENFCELVYCKTSPTVIQTTGHSYVDGTKCGENKWCFHLKCIEVGERPEAVNGGWSKWSNPTECSRTCGGGTSTASRECDNPTPANGGRYCLGDRKKVTTCNMQPCPQGSTPFREMQCTKHNTIPLKGVTHTWKPYLKRDEPCVLYCLNEENVFHRLEPRTIDGTPCKPATKDMCIAGACVKVGCDGVINSDATEDVCGICNGDGTQCKLIEHTYTNTGRGYTKAATIPAGVRNIFVEETKPSANMIALTDKTGNTYFLNGNYQESPDIEFLIGKVEAVYRHPEENQELLVIKGPSDQDLVLMICFFEATNVGYKFRYTEPASESEYLPKYHWEILSFGDCSAKCGGGIQQAEMSCSEEKAGKVSPTFCQDLEKPEASTKKCNEQPCKTKWRVGKWGPCHACKYKSGVRLREVECVRQSPHPGTEDILVEDSECKGPRPATRELCNAPKKCKIRSVQYGLPDSEMQDVWQQIKSARKMKKRSDNVCEPEKKVKIKVGSIVQDHVNPDDIKVDVIPLKSTSMTINLTDSAFESMGDVIGDTKDEKKIKHLQGKAAADEIIRLEHKNNTANRR
ncbi:A disintegrin and metalloproteinase with thrombospondin motifs 12-like [Coccinella septempunctata]|uniref:A disintegrin and metalloproteinase with thrombospondin motifs 12-like n=1 Tax=Coccinella septempunctata TaxID=41139 RepID=UPI001D0981BE|nr:A disintegrin and metalloproteinase with thrombospondin motifs 12-like [Coccinella septempunctata]